MLIFFSTIFCGNYLWIHLSQNGPQKFSYLVGCNMLSINLLIHLNRNHWFPKCSFFIKWNPHSSQHCLVPIHFPFAGVPGVLTLQDSTTGLHAQNKSDCLFTSLNHYNGVHCICFSKAERPCSYQQLILSPFPFPPPLVGWYQGGLTGGGGTGD